MRALASALALALLVTARGEAQNCKKGIPCGNSCIAANKTCRIGTSSSTSRSSQPSQPPRPFTSQPAGQGSNTPTAASSETRPEWVASLADGVYFKRDCEPAQDLAPSNRRYFMTQVEAQDAGFRRSRTKGC